jgi:outer membrane protein OmpA-like peptidoglycan-associated protein
MKTCVATAAAIVLLCWTASAQDQPKFGAYLGYDYIRFSSASDNQFNTNVPAFSANGGSGEFIYRFNRRLSGVIDMGAVHQDNLAGFNADTTIANFLAGPRFNFLGRHSRFQPFAQVLLGGVYATSSIGFDAISASALGPVIGPGQLITARVGATDWGFALTAGLGLDIRLNRHISFRPAQVEYYYTRLQNLRAYGDNSQNNFRYSGGFAFWFGGEKPAPVAHRIQTKTCPNGSVIPINEACPKIDFSMSLVATPAQLCPGDTARFTPTISGAQPHQLTFSTWSVNGKPVSQAGSFEFNSDGMGPGTYTVKLTSGSDTFNPASAETTVTVLAYQPPTGTAQANPAEIKAGDKSTVTSSFQNQCGGPIQAAMYEASEGTMQGDQFDSSTIQWDASNYGEQRKTVTITAKAADNKSVGTATTTIEVVKGASPQPVRLPDILFPDNNSRVNNCGKRILLEQLRAYYERDSSGTVVLVGNQSPDEKNANLSAERAANAAAVITAGTGVCLSIPQTQVQVSSPGVDQNGVGFEAGFCRSSVGPISANTDMRRVQVWFVPSGGQIPASVTNAQNASTLNVSRLGCPK